MCNDGVCVLDGRVGDQVAWTLRTSADSICNGTGPASEIKTAAYLMSSSQEKFQLHDSALPGSWFLCYKPSGGSWSRVEEFLIIRGTPTFTPAFGTAGSLTPITLSPAAIDGDLIVIQQNDCSQAHLLANAADYSPMQVRIKFLFVLQLFTNRVVPTGCIKFRGVDFSFNDYPWDILCVLCNSGIWWK